MTTRPDGSGSRVATSGAPEGGLLRRGRRLVDWLLSASVVGVTTSVLIHLALGVIAAGVVVVGGVGGIDGGLLGADTTVEVLSETELTALEEAPIGVEDDTLEKIPEFAPPQIDLAAAPAPEGGMIGAAPGDLDTTGGAGLGAGGAGEGLGDFGAGAGMGGAGGGSARFFGVEARGSRFAYIVDISGSMSGPKLDALKSELGKSVTALLEHASFSIVLYNSGAAALGGRTRWTDATDRHKDNAGDMIRRITASGATNPAPAFEMVFALRPRPDAIYFMTDGLFAADVAPFVEQLNRAGGAIIPVHCISFVSRESEAVLQQIAADSDGTYTHIAGPTP